MNEIHINLPQPQNLLYCVILLMRNNTESENVAEVQRLQMHAQVNSRAVSNGKKLDNIVRGFDASISLLSQGAIFAWQKALKNALRFE